MPQEYNGPTRPRSAGVRPRRAPNTEPPQLYAHRPLLPHHRHDRGRASGRSRRCRLRRLRRARSDSRPLLPVRTKTISPVAAGCASYAERDGFRSAGAGLSGPAPSGQARHSRRCRLRRLRRACRACPISTAGEYHATAVHPPTREMSGSIPDKSKGMPERDGPEDECESQ